MIQTSSILENASSKSGFKRVFYKDSDAPASIDQVCVLPLFGSISEIIYLSSILIKQFKEKLKPSKYLIVCSWPGMRAFFPYVNEFWELSNDAMDRYYWGNPECSIVSKPMEQYIRNLNYFFQDVILPEEISKYVSNGVKKEYFDNFNKIKIFMPTIQSSVVLGSAFNKSLSTPGKKAFIFPVKRIKSWKYNRINYASVSKGFWLSLTKYLISMDIKPVVLHSCLCHDISQEMLDSCLYVKDDDYSSVLSAVRGCDFSIDFFSGYSIISAMARTPYLFFDERSRYWDQKQYEFDDLALDEIPKKYIFSFAPVLEAGEEQTWRVNFFDILPSKINELNKISEGYSPSGGEVDKVSLYENVRRLKNHKVGTKFLKIKRI